MLHIKRKKRRLKLPKNYDTKSIQIGLPINDINLLKEFGISNVGDTFLPPAKFGKTCKINAVGYSYPDKTKELEWRYICTIWIHPYGNKDLDQIPIDIHRWCYPRIEVAPTEISFTLYENKKKELFVLANLRDKDKTKDALIAINTLIEIFHECYVYENFSNISLNIQKFIMKNWEILPPGESFYERIYKKNAKSDSTNKPYDFDEERIKTLDKYKCEEKAVGINGFDGYYAYVFKKCCVFESAIYGNATYIVPNANWESLSQKSKKELYAENAVIAKIVHNKHWIDEISQALKSIENQDSV